MSLVVDPTWQSSLDFLRELRRVPAAQSNAVILAQARNRWQHAVIARTSMHDLLFTLPGDDYPFTSSVRVQAAADHHALVCWETGRLVEQAAADTDQVDSTLDAFLERLTSPLRRNRHGLG